MYAICFIYSFAYRLSPQAPDINSTRREIFVLCSCCIPVSWNYGWYIEQVLDKCWSTEWINYKWEKKKMLEKQDNLSAHFILANQNSNWSQFLIVLVYGDQKKKNKTKPCQNNCYRLGNILNSCRSRISEIHWVMNCMFLILCTEHYSE